MDLRAPGAARRPLDGPPGAVLAHVERGTEQRLVHESSAPGVERLLVTSTLRRGEPGTLFSWVHNNLWDSDSPVEQAFAATFTVIAVAAAGTVEATATTTADAVTRPLRPALLHGTGETAPAESSLARVEDDRVRIVAVTTVEDHPGDLLVRLQSYADEAVSTQLRCARPVAGAWAATHLGHESTGPLPLSHAAAALTLAPFDVTAVRVRLAP
ncbi:hypothetical protein [Kineococcus sp. SYSU DK006]|uniref:hypothetical protein n=1 Tax=Kineococcus sp. SYSU DK006 TaxID=3383127 RepID=UPI003D7CFB36